MTGQRQYRNDGTFQRSTEFTAKTNKNDTSSWRKSDKPQQTEKKKSNHPGWDLSGDSTWETVGDINRDKFKHMSPKKEELNYSNKPILSQETKIQHQVQKTSPLKVQPTPENVNLSGSTSSVQPTIVYSQQQPQPQQQNLQQIQMQQMQQQNFLQQQLQQQQVQQPQQPQQLFNKSQTVEEIDRDERIWYYVDPDKKIRGLFSGKEMNTWLMRGFFGVHLNVAKRSIENFKPLAQMCFEVYPLRNCFTGEPLLPFLRELSEKNPFKYDMAICLYHCYSTGRIPMTEELGEYFIEMKSLQQQQQMMHSYHQFQQQQMQVSQNPQNPSQQPMLQQPIPQHPMSHQQIPQQQIPQQNPQYVVTSPGPYQQPQSNTQHQMQQVQKPVQQQQLQHQLQLQQQQLQQPTVQTQPQNFQRVQVGIEGLQISYQPQSPHKNTEKTTTNQKLTAPTTPSKTQTPPIQTPTKKVVETPVEVVEKKPVWQTQTQVLNIYEIQQEELRRKEKEKQEKEKQDSYRKSKETTKKSWGPPSSGHKVKPFREIQEEELARKPKRPVINENIPITKPSVNAWSRTIQPTVPFKDIQEEEKKKSQTTIVPTSNSSDNFWDYDPERQTKK